MKTENLRIYEHNHKFKQLFIEFDELLTYVYIASDIKVFYLHSTDNHDALYLKLLNMGFITQYTTDNKVIDRSMIFNSGKTKIYIFVINDVGKIVLDYVVKIWSISILENDFYTLFYAIGNLDVINDKNQLLATVRLLIKNYS